MKLVFIVGSLTDSHIIKRVEAFIEQGYEVDLYGYMRGVNFTNRFSKIEPKVIGQLQNAHYYKRLLKGYKEVRDIIKQYPNDTLFYVWGYDIAMVNWFLHTRYIYEISDIRWGKFPSPLRRVFGWLDRSIINRSKLTLLTSEGFIGFIGLPEELKKKIVLMPNKLAPQMLLMKRPDSSSKGRRIRIGYIGLYRYPNTVVKMARMIGEEFKNKMEFHFSGLSNSPELKALIEGIAKDYDNVYEHGPFKNPDDLSRVYDTIDVVAANYDTSGMNERVAEPNKLYESIFFNKPIIVSEGTFLSEKVKQLGCGFVLNNDDESMRSFLNGLTCEKVYEIAEIENRIESKWLVEQYEDLFTRINNL